MTSNNHIPVLSKETIANLKIKKDGIYVDMTLGRGGHSELILEQLNSKGKLIAIDQDNTAIQYCKNKFKNDNRITLIKNNFSNLIDILHSLKIDFVDGIIMDLGISSPQIDNPERGFSYYFDGPLDMRMDQMQKLSAFDIINYSSKEELVSIFKKYGEINNPIPVVNKIIKTRQEHLISSTLQLVELIKATITKKELLKKKHFAKCYFQAIRIAVNDELNILTKTIEIATQFLKKNGRLAIITFHSLEDKIVLKKFQDITKINLPKEVPIIPDDYQSYKIVNTHAIVATDEELNNNKRARSAQLRIIEKIK